MVRGFEIQSVFHTEIQLVNIKMPLIDFTTFESCEIILKTCHQYTMLYHGCHEHQFFQTTAN